MFKVPCSVHDNVQMLASALDGTLVEKMYSHEVASPPLQALVRPTRCSFRIRSASSIFQARAASSLC